MKTLFNRFTAARTKKYFNPNSGQVIVLLAFMAVGLIAIMGLAIDGGRVLFLRRDTQNAADAAAMAAARAICTARQPGEYALAAADANGFDNDGESNWVTVSSPPTNAGFNIPAECAGCYVQVDVKGEIPPSFIGMVYDGDLAATASSIGVCDPDVNNVGSQAPELRAVWAMSDSCSPDPVTITGSHAEIVGGIHSNGTAKVQPAGCGCQSAKVTGATSVVDRYNSKAMILGEDKVTWSAGTSGTGGSSGSDTTATGLCQQSCFDNIATGEVPANGKPYLTAEKTEYPLSFNVADFAPGAKYAVAAGAQYYQYDCKTSTFWDWVLANHYNSSTKTLDTGIYYAACDMNIGKASNNTAYKGEVTFVSTATIDVKGDGQKWTPYVDNLLLFANGNTGCGGKGAIKFSGKSNTWSGYIFAPNGSIKLAGSSNKTADGCAVGLSVEVSGADNVIKCNTASSENEPQPAFWIGG